MKQVKRLLKLKRSWLLLLFPLAFLSYFLASKSREIAEHVFARGIFKVLSWIMAHVTALLGPFVIFILLICFVVRLVRKKEDRGFRLAKGFLNVACIAAVAVFLLIIGCSVNYYRYSVGEYLDLEIEPAAKEELYGLVVKLAKEASDVREELEGLEGEDGVYALSMSKKALGKEAVKAFQNLSEEYPVFRGYYPQPKRLIFSATMSRTELTGIFCPFTMEANVNVDIPDYSIASTMCHELAHLNGFIREDEANYISYLACQASNSLELRYSGLMEALILSGNALYAKDKDLDGQARAYYSDGVNRDLRANSAYWAKFNDTPVSNAATKLNDAYLKANHQEDGVQSYGRMVDLLLAEYRKEEEQ